MGTELEVVATGESAERQAPPGEGAFNYFLATAPASLFISVEEAASLAGCHPKTIGRWSACGKLPPLVTFGGCRGFTAGAARELVETRERKAASEALRFRNRVTHLS